MGLRTKIDEVREARHPSNYISDIWGRVRDQRIALKYRNMMGRTPVGSPRLLICSFYVAFSKRRLSSISIVLVDKEATFGVKHLTEIVLVIIQGVGTPLARRVVSSPFFECVLRVGHILNSIPYFPYSNHKLLLLWRTTARM